MSLLLECGVIFLKTAYYIDKYILQLYANVVRVSDH